MGHRRDPSPGPDVPAGRRRLPLCPTKPGGPPTEIARADFEVAVFDNRFPSLRPDPEEPAVDGSDLTPVEPSFGACEVVVYTPEHAGRSAR